MTATKIKNMTDEEIDQVKDDRNYWESIKTDGEWRLTSFTGTQSATFVKGEFSSNMHVTLNQGILELLCIPDVMLPK